MEPNNSPMNSSQLVLELDWGKEPWQGRTPRSLTGAPKVLFFRQKPPSHEVFFDSEQLEFWPVEKATQKEEPRAISPGASLLLEP